MSYDASLTYSVQCPPTAPLLGYSGAAFAVILSSIGAAYGTCKSGVGIAGMGVNNPGQVMKALIPVVMAGVIGIYGLIVCVIISTSVEAPANQNFNPKYSLFTGFGHFFAGLTIGLSGLAAGVCVGVVGDAGVRGFGQEPRLFVGENFECIQSVACADVSFVGMILVLIFAEALALYGLIVALVLNGKAVDGKGCIPYPILP